MSDPALDEARERVRIALDDGENLIAHDAASQALEHHPGDARLQHGLLLALARAGGAVRAREIYDEWNLDAAAAAATAPGLSEDLLSLRARLDKDLALSLTAAEGRAAASLAASRSYGQVHAVHPSAYVAVNAATMALLAGDRAGSAEWAATARSLVDPDDAWGSATLAEVGLIEGRLDDVGIHLEDYAETMRDRPGTLATTRRQLRLLAHHLDIDESVLAPISAASVLHFTGHMAPLAADPAAHDVVIDDIRQATRELVLGRGVSEAHGSAACGSDLIIIEELQRHDVPVHIVLPFEADLFRTTSVATGGPEWLPIFDTALSRAASVTVAVGQPDPDPTVYAHAAQLAMGRALVRAHEWSTPAVQLAVWDGRAPTGPAGSAADHQTWLRAGGEAVVVTAPTDRAKGTSPGQEHQEPDRELRAMLFADIKGFSRLRDAQIASVVAHVIARLADSLGDVAGSVTDRNTWGDAIFVTFDDMASAAKGALAMQDAMQRIDLVALGLPSFIGLRVGLHAGPVLTAYDFVRDRPVIIGSEVNRAARIEPITPVGQVYVSDVFAALLALDPTHRMTTQYVGQLPLAKGYGTFPMHVLTK